MTRIYLGFQIAPPNDAPGTGLSVQFQAGSTGGLAIDITPVRVPAGGDAPGWSIQDALLYLGQIFGIAALEELRQLDPPWPWKKLFSDVQMLPSLQLQVAGKPAAALSLQLFDRGGQPEDGVLLGAGTFHGISIEPAITVYALEVAYDPNRAKKLDLKARVAFSIPGQANGKPQLLTYPFPLPDQNSSDAFKLNFLALGQRFAPPPSFDASDPLAATFANMEKVFTSDDPATILTTLVQDYYKPDVGWFAAADLEVRGFRLRAVMADPVLYGLEISCSAGMFEGLLAEILYQKIGSDLGVFYGCLVLPEHARQVQLGGAAATIPSLQAWIYTNGDFKIAIGWPLGPNSFYLQVDIFVGQGALYFGKLRSGDNPSGRQGPQTHYNPVLVVGLALKIGVAVGISDGPVSAQASLTLQGVFQGLLAWRAAGQSPHSIAALPDYYWFSASVTLAGVVQGSVDLGIISATVCIQVWANIAAAFETDRSTVVEAQVGVDVAVSIHVAFFTIHLHFSTTLDLSYTLIHQGDGTAALDGPSNKELAAFIPQTRAAPLLPAARLLARSRQAALAGAPLGPIQLNFLLLPTVCYDDGGIGQLAAVGSLLIACPDVTAGSPDDGSCFQLLADHLSQTLLACFGGGDEDWRKVASALGASGTPVTAQFTDMLSHMLSALTFNITGRDLSDASQKKMPAAAIFPMLDALVMQVGDASWQFGCEPLTSAGYPAQLAAYFAELAALTPAPSSARGQRAVPGPSGPSLPHLMLVNWFLAFSRQIAAAMCKTAPLSALERRDARAAVPLSALASIASNLSRMALHGSRLPDPAMLAGGAPICEDIIAPLYCLMHQQFAAAAGAPISASLSAAGRQPGQPGPTITFGGAATATAVLGQASVPVQPQPGWRAQGAQLEATPSYIAVAPLDCLSPGPLCIALTAQTACAPGLMQGPARLLALPAAAQAPIGASAAAAPLTAQLRNTPDNNDPVTPALAGLLIPLGLRRVPIIPDGNVSCGATGDAPATATQQWSRDVYMLTGTDDDTRALLEQALDERSSQIRRIVPLILQGGSLHSAPVGSGDEALLMFKSNLSTTSQPETLTTPMLLRKRLADLGPSCAGLDDTKDFLRLVWEASVVHTSGFYLRFPAADGAALPDAIFDKDVARFWLWLDLSGQQVPPAASLPAYTNSLLVADTGDASKSTHYLSLKQADKLLEQWHPAYPPGCVGAELVWNEPPQPDPQPYSAAALAALYQLVELRIGEGGGFKTSNWSTSLGAMKQSTQDGMVSSAIYRQVVPAWRYLSQSATSPYAAVGAPARLQFRLSDLYGNVLQDPDCQYRAEFPVRYNDTLLAPSHWPGCQLAYDLQKSTPQRNAPEADAAGLSLTVTVRFDPTGMQAHSARRDARVGDPGQAGAALAAARATWLTIYQQAQDPNVSVLVSSTLYGDAAPGDIWPTVGTPSDTLRQYRQLVELLYQEICKPQPGPCMHTITLDFDIARIATCSRDIIPFGVRLGLFRAGVDSEVAQRLPEVAAALTLLVPDLPTAPPQAAPTSPASPLQCWAKRLEPLLSNFDGANGQVKLAYRPQSSDGDAAIGPGLTAVRLSLRAGIAVARAAQPASPAYFTMQPFATSLEYGEVDITTWDSELHAHASSASPAAVDADTLAGLFLSSFDRLMAPDLAGAIAALDKQAFATLARCKAAIAQALAGRLIPVYSGQADGDIGAASAQFEQALLARLSDAYAIAAVVQTPMTLSVSAGAAGAIPARLHGGLAATQASAAAICCTLSSPKLALDQAEPHPWLSFVVSVKDAGKSSTIALSQSWNISHIEDDIGASDQHYGYVPSAWLKFVVPDIDRASPLSIDLGSMDVPVPLRRYPSLPKLISQSASRPDGSSNRPWASTSDPIDTSIRAAMLWPLRYEIDYPKYAAQDDLWITSTFNEPIGWQPESSTGAGPITALTRALVRFEAGFNSVASALPQLHGSERVFGGKLVAILVKLVADVAAAFASVRVADALYARNQLLWVLRYADMHHHRLCVFARLDDGQASDAPPKFPRIKDGRQGQASPIAASQAPDNKPHWWMASYDFGAAGISEKLVLSADKFEQLSYRTVIGSAHVVRNADLGAGINPLLIYRTPEVYFSNVLVPYVEVQTPLGPLQGADLAAMLASILAPFAAVSKDIGGGRTIRMAAVYHYPVLPGYAGTMALMADCPAIMNAGQSIADDPAPMAGHFAEQLAAWWKDSGLTDCSASLSLSLSLFIDIASAGAPPHPIPMLQIDRIDLVLPDHWADAVLNRLVAS
ncbi:hypothetical protein Jab_2c14070 [Janthinobacterium sp. HH01]|uniref:hypothetical protein n=1 Tax=Janthinobacterium sp. HH01 TaxID=1198452 RepID=UPI0002AED470|nr:hypothetical protein [Janthinobacterium sp. HH01]ELX09341.1 hypothetical protein Jab_2c14070 [Janthinobacterium sp. HH01]